MATSSMTPTCEKEPEEIPRQGDVIRAFQKTGTVNVVSPDTNILDREKEKIEKYLVCAYCAHIITSPDDAIAVDGSATHSLTNPAGITFNIGCFREAPGCSTAGEPTSEFTWFPGFMWSYALCSRCRAHMGWRYQSGMTSFFGLILDNLREN
jgi:hypothetical protein